MPIKAKDGDGTIILSEQDCPLCGSKNGGEFVLEFDRMPPEADVFMSQIFGTPLEFTVIAVFICSECDVMWQEAFDSDEPGELLGTDF